MPRFLSPAWVEAFNAALDGVVLSGPGAETVADDHGRVTVVEEVHGTPDGDIGLVLTIDNGTVHLGFLGTADDPRPDVTIRVSYEDAAALSRGESTAAEALNAGRIRVRGDLAVLVASQQLLGAARTSAAGLDATTTY